MNEHIKQYETIGISERQQQWKQQILPYLKEQLVQLNKIKGLCEKIIQRNQPN